MKALLWIVLIACLIANVYLNFAVERDSRQVMLSVAAGVGVVASGVGLWMARSKRS